MWSRKGRACVRGGASVALDLAWGPPRPRLQRARPCRRKGPEQHPAERRWGRLVRSEETRWPAHPWEGSGRFWGAGRNQQVQKGEPGYRRAPTDGMTKGQVPITKAVLVGGRRAGVFLLWGGGFLGEGARCPGSLPGAVVSGACHTPIGHLPAPSETTPHCPQASPQLSPGPAPRLLITLQKPWDSLPTGLPQGPRLSPSTHPTKISHRLLPLHPSEGRLHPLDPSSCNLRTVSPQAWCPAPPPPRGGPPRDRSPPTAV